MKQQVWKGLALALSVIIMISACRKKDAPLPDNLANFEASEQGIAPAVASITVKVKLTRATDRDIPVTISLTSNTATLVYGTKYTTTPATTSNAINLVIPSGAAESSFILTKAAGAAFTGSEAIAFKIESTGAPVIIGTTNVFTLKFAEIVSTGSTTVGDGGGPTYGNKVFFDLSANDQVAVQRTKWDLGFYTGSDDWRVTVNSATAMMAKQINKNDLTAVTAADTVGFGNDVVFNQTAPTTASLAYIDYPSGDLTKTAIAAVSATATDNKVYIINRGTGIGNPAPARGWKKIRIIRNAGGGYTLQHADIASTTFTSIDIPKDDAYFFKYISFENGAVSVEPLKKKWDFAWTYFSNVTNFGGGEVPYLFQDMVIQNRNVSIAKVMTATKAYADFGEADIAAQTWLGTQNAVGADWRSGGGPGVAPAVRADRYYIIKDADNNYYKVRFTAMTQNGDRGYPAFEFALVKRG